MNSLCDKLAFSLVFWEPWRLSRLLTFRIFLESGFSSESSKEERAREISEIILDDFQCNLQRGTLHQQVTAIVRSLQEWRQYIEVLRNYIS